MSNNKDFKVKNGIQPTVYHEGLGTVVTGSEGYYLSGGSYDSVSFSVSGQDADPYGLFFRSDGAKMYVAGDAGNDINEYNLSTPWVVSSASYSQNFSVASQESAPNGVFFKTDGTKMFVVGTATDTVYEYALSSAWDISSASYSSVSFSVGSQDTVPSDLAFNPDGTKMFILGSTGDNVYEYALSSAWVVSSASYTRSFSLASQETGPQGLFFSEDGLNMFVAGSANDSIFQYSLSTAFDISTSSYSQAFSVSSQENDPQALFFKSDGTKMYVLGSVSDTVFQYSTTLNTASLDLSTGSVFDYTPTSDVQVTLSNPAASGTVSGATLLLEGAEATGVANTFSTTLYTGNSGTQTITNGIDLAGDGGMVWGKVRSISDNNWIVDSENGIGSNGTYNYLQTNLATGLSNFGDRSVSSFNSDGFTLANSTNDQFNLSPETYVSWTFKKQSSFFDVVTYTGNGVAGRSISHSLNSDVGTILFKRTDSTSNWIVWHRSAGGAYGFLDATDAFTADSGISNPTTTAFTIESTINAGWNASGGTYVAYLFAHDTDASSLIKCGSYTGNGSNTGPVINLGWEPQWLMFKNASASVRETVACDWMIFDNVRGIEPSPSKRLEPNTNDAEVGNGIGLNVTSTGFQIDDFNRVLNFSGDTFIYIAIRAENIPTITYDPTLEWPGGTAPTAPAKGETDVVTFNTRDGGSTYQGVLAIDGAK